MNTEDQFLGVNLDIEADEDSTPEASGKRSEASKLDPLGQFLSDLKAPRKPSAELVKSTGGDPVATAARDHFKGFTQAAKQAGLYAKDTGAQDFAAEVRKVSGGFDGVALMRQIREGR